MKKFIAFMAIVVAPVLIQAQETPLSSLYSEYVDEPGFQTTEMLPGTTSYDWEKDIQSEEIKDMLKAIESVRIMEYHGDGKYSLEKVWKKITSAARADIYTEVISVRGDEEQAGLYMLKESAGVFREIALVAFEKETVTLIMINGNIDFNRLLSPGTLKSLRELGQYMKGKGECGVK